MKLAQNVNLEAVAKDIDGFVGLDIAALCNDLIKKGGKSNNFDHFPEITSKDFE